MLLCIIKNRHDIALLFFPVDDDLVRTATDMGRIFNGNTIHCISEFSLHVKTVPFPWNAWVNA